MTDIKGYKKLIGLLPDTCDLRLKFPGKKQNESDQSSESSEETLDDLDDLDDLSDLSNLSKWSDPEELSDPGKSSTSEIPKKPIVPAKRRHRQRFSHSSFSSLDGE
jgi:hypothetical protein